MFIAKYLINYVITIFTLSTCTITSTHQFPDISNPLFRMKLFSNLLNLGHLNVAYLTVLNSLR